MKARICLIVILLLCELIASAEESYLEGAFSSPVTNGEMFTEPGQDTQNMRRFQDCPVNHSTGTVEVSVPIMTLKTKDLNLDIALSYHTGGIRASQTAGSLGLGWSLSGLPRISRQIIGRPDERYSVTVKEPSDSTLSNGYVASILNSGIDSYFDIFSYDVPGYSGSFYYGADGKLNLFSADGVTILPSQVESRDIESFTLITPEGVEYTFAARERIKYFESEKELKEDYNIEYDGVTTSWAATKIHSRTESDVEPIKITYSNGLPYLTKRSSAAYFATIEQQPDSLIREVHDDKYYKKHENLYETHPIIPEAIVTPSTFVRFETDNFWWDLEEGEHPTGNLTFITGAVWRDKMRHRELRKVKFEYDDTYITAGIWNNTRARLKSVTITAGDTIIDSRTFSYTPYYTGYPFIDAYGNYISFTLKSKKSPMDDFEWVRPMRSSPGSGSWGLLNRIKDANNCITEFTYQANSCLDDNGDSVYIGQRIKSILVTDSVTGRKRLRTFTYANPSLSIDVSQIPVTAYETLTGIDLKCPDDLNLYIPKRRILSYTKSVEPRIPGASIESATIYYSDIIEEISGTDILRPIRTRWEYDVTPMLHAIRTVEPYVHTVPAGIPKRLIASLTFSENDTIDRETMEKLFIPHPLNAYIEKQYGGKPLLLSRSTYEWRSNAYQLVENETHVWSKTTPVFHNVGIQCEPLIFRSTKKAPNIKPPATIDEQISFRYEVADKSTDAFIYNVFAQSATWQCESVYNYKYYQNGKTRVETIGFRYNQPIVDSQNPLVQSSDVLRTFPSTVTYSCGGEEVEVSTLYSGNIPGLLKDKGFHSLPVLERTVYGTDTINVRYEYVTHKISNRYDTVPCLSRRTVSRGDAIIEQVRYYTFDDYCYPESICNSSGVTVALKWNKAGQIKEQTIGDLLTTKCTYRDHVSCSSVTYPSGKRRFYDWKGTRLVAERSEDAVLNAWNYGIFCQDGANFIEQTKTTSNFFTATERTLYDGFGMPYMTVAPNASGKKGLDLIVGKKHDALNRLIGSTPVTPVYSGEVPRNYERARYAADQFFQVDNPTQRIEYREGNGSEQAEKLHAPGNSTSTPLITEVYGNSANEPLLRCRRFSMRGDNLQSRGYYADGLLEVTKVTDPDGNEALTFTDWRGRKLLERRVTDDDSDSFVDTYYIYDDGGRLLTVLMPEAVPADMSLTGEMPMSASIDKNAWRYKYDAYGRLCEKRAPGCGAERYRYDVYGRMAFSQNPEERTTGRCRFYLYDAQGRNVLIGMCNDSFMPENGQLAPEMTVDAVQNVAGIDGSGYVAKNLNDFTGTLLVAKYFDTTAFKTVSGFTEIPRVNTVTPRPGLLMAVKERIFEGQPLLTNTLPEDTDTPEFKCTIYDYDTEERPVYTASTTTRPGEYLCTTTVYDVVGNPLAVSNALCMADGTVKQETSSYSYDAMGRPLRTISSFGNNSATVAENYYDHAGRLYFIKGIGGNSLTRYDICNRPTTMQNDAFTEDFTYTPAGRIRTRTTVPVGSYREKREYWYDAVGRLSAVTLANPSGSMLPEMTATYNRNSSPLSISRYAITSGGSMTAQGDVVLASEQVDDLSFKYDGNRVVKTTDEIASPRYNSYDYHDGADDACEYTYDEMGRLTSDLNRGIASIRWNPASRPYYIDLGNDSWIEYTYSASGQLLAERERAEQADDFTLPWSLSATQAAAPAGGDIYIPSDKYRVTLSSRRFVGPFELEGDSIVRVQVQGGYWDAEGVTHGYIGDWQGNVRALRAANGTLEQRTDYYPYGAPSQSDNPAVSPYKYSGKRLETRYALNLSHHGARFLLHDIASFAQPDPLAELTYGNPYLYCSADPINRTDPTGLYETAKEALQAAEKYYPGQNVMIKRDELSAFWYIAYQSNGEERRDFGRKDPYKLSSNAIMNLLSSLSFSNDMKMLIAELGDPEFSQTPYGKFFSYVGKGLGLIEAIASGWSIYKANKYGCKSDRICYKFLLDAVLNLAAMGDPEPGSKAYFLGLYYTYVVTDLSTNGFGLNYEVTTPLFVNTRKSKKKK